jgi:hypothetical protein
MPYVISSLRRDVKNVEEITGITGKNSSTCFKVVQEDNKMNTLL